MTKNPDTKDQTGTPRPGPSSSKQRGAIAAWIVLSLLVGLAGGFLLSRQLPPSPPPAAQNATEAQREPDLVQRIGEVDHALVRALSATRPDVRYPHALSVEQREHEGRKYPFQNIRLPQMDRKTFHDRLVKELAQPAPSAKLTRITSEAWDIAIDGLPTHRLNLAPETPQPAPAVKPAKGRVAIVIDDMGEDINLAKELAKLGVPVAFSIWPDSGNREGVLKIAKAAGREILIHLPMQPKGFPKVNPGPHPLLVSMPPEQINSTVLRAVQRVHGAIGVNNHMGSEFTESNLGMRLALTTMQNKGLFFLDSRTSAATVGVVEAKRLGMRVHQRDVFLDNELNVSAIVQQLRKAEALAREKGHAIAIGHPHKETLKALRLWLKEKDDAVHVVTVSSLPPL